MTPRKKPIALYPQSQIDYEALTTPFEDSQIKYRTVSGRQLRYIDMRDVQHRLDMVVGCDNWYNTSKLHQAGNLIWFEVTIFIRIGESWVGKTDMGETRDLTKTQIKRKDKEDIDDPLFPDFAKAAYSDAFKRAAVQWGIGRHLYSEQFAPPRPAATEPAKETTPRPYAPIDLIYELRIAALRLQQKGKYLEKADETIVQALHDSFVTTFAAIKNSNQKSYYREDVEKVYTDLLTQCWFISDFGQLSYAELKVVEKWINSEHAPAELISYLEYRGI